VDGVGELPREAGSREGEGEETYILAKGELKRKE
jgi:hypothetical protein